MDTLGINLELFAVVLTLISIDRTLRRIVMTLNQPRPQP